MIIASVFNCGMLAMERVSAMEIVESGSGDIVVTIFLRSDLPPDGGVGMPKEPKECQQFVALSNRLLSVSKETLDARMAAYKDQAAPIPKKRGRSRRTGSAL